MKRLDNLATFKPTKKLQEVVIDYLVTHYANDEDKEELLKAFKAIDQDNDGKITREELYNAFAPYS